MNELSILDKINGLSGKTEIAKALKDNVKNPQLQELLDAALNFKRKFYIKKFGVKPEGSTHTCRHREFIEILQELESGRSRGDVAKTIVESFFLTLTPQQAKWYERVLKKKLLAGFSLSSAVKAGFDIPEFKVMLAKDGKKSPKAEEMVQKGGFVSIKLDGYRCLAVIENGQVELLSRNGTVYENFPSVTESLSESFPKGKYVFDGEIMSDDFQAMQMTAFAAKKGRTVGDVQYHIFDYIDYDEWMSGKFTTKKSQRISDLEKLKFKFKNKVLKRVKQDWVSGKDAMKTISKIERAFISQGFEGAMFLPDVPYYLGRKSNKLMKFKTMLSQDVKIVGFYEGNNKYEGTLGGVMTSQENGKACKVGSGFSDADRDYIWNHQNKFKDRIFEAKYQEETPDGIMRFPVFFRWRKDKDKK